MMNTPTPSASPGMTGTGKAGLRRLRNAALAVGCVAIGALALTGVAGANLLAAAALAGCAAALVWPRSKPQPGSQALAEREQLLQAAIDAVPMAMYVKDLSQRMVVANRASGEWIGRRPEDMVGMHLAEFSKVVRLPEGQEERIARTDAEVLETGRPVEFQMERILPDGIHPMRVIKSPIRNAAGEIAWIQLLVEDVAAAHAAAQDLKAQRTLLRTLVDALPLYLYVKDRSNRFILVNEAMERQIPKSAPSLIGQEMLFHARRQPGEIESTREDNRRVMEEGATLDFQRAVAITGVGTRHLRTIKVPLRDDQGQIVGLVGIDEDVTDRVRAENEVRDQRERLQAVLDAIPQDLFVKDLSGIITLVNERLSRRWNRPKEALIGLRGHGLQGLTAADLERIDVSDRRVMETGAEDTWVQQMVDASEQLKTFRIHKVPLRDRGGKIMGLVMTGEDISELAASQQELAASQHLLRTVLDTIPESVTLKDTDLRYKVVNRTAPHRVGVRNDDLIGKDIGDMPLLTPEGREEIQRADRAVLETARPVILPLVRWEGPGMPERWERVLKQPILDAEGKVTGIVTVGEDITELVQVRQTAERGRVLLQTIINSLPAGVFVKDLQGRFTLANSTFAASQGMTPDEIVGLTSMDMPHRTPEQKQRGVEGDQVVLDGAERSDTGVVAGTQIPGRLPGWERIIKVPLRDEAGTLFGIVGHVEDVTTEKNAEEERLALSRLMERTQNLESLGVMAGGIAHEFNNLLQRILGHTELVLSTMPKDDPTRGDVEMIQSAGRTAVGLTNQMVSLSGRSRFNVEALQLQDIVLRLLVEVRSLLPAGAVLSHHLGQDTQTVRADEALLQQVIISLVINATEALPEHHGHIRLEVGTCTVTRQDQNDRAYSNRTLAPGEYAYVDVRDNGPGIPQQILERLYEPFFSTKFIGRGLGLAAVRGIVHGHHGSLHVSSKLGEGTTFRVLLPLAEG